MKKTKTLVLTGCDRNMDAIGSLTCNNHRAYALRHGYDFERFTDYEGLTYHPSWHKLHLLKDRLQKYEQILWLDADAVVTNPGLELGKANLAHPTAPLTVSGDWSGEPDNCPDWHFSMGNFIATPEALALIDRALELEATYGNHNLWEQECLQWIYKHEEQWRPYYGVMPRRTLNAVPGDLPGLFQKPAEPWQPGDFLAHLTWIGMDKRAELFWHYDQAGIRSLMPDLPEWWEPSWCADLRHIACIKEFIRLLVDRCECRQPINVTEIGSHTGASTSAFMAACRFGHISLDIVDVNITEKVQQVIQNVPNVTPFQMSSHDYMKSENAKDRKVWFVDGCHELYCVREEARLLDKLRPAVIMAHDINATISGFGQCEGAMYLKQYLQSAGYYCLEDIADRPCDERTKRGFMVACRDLEDVKTAQKALAMTCY